MKKLLALLLFILIGTNAFAKDLNAPNTFNSKVMINADLGVSGNAVISGSLQVDGGIAGDITSDESTITTLNTSEINAIDSGGVTVTGEWYFDQMAYGSLNVSYNTTATTIEPMSANDTVRMKIENETDSSDPTIKNGALTIYKIAPYPL